MITVPQALSLISEMVQPVSEEMRELSNSLGCLLASAVESAENSPPFDKSMMDGYAVRSGDLTTGETELEVIGEVTAGNVSTVDLAPGSAIRIMTGAPIPGGADAVIPVEQSQLRDPQCVILRILAAVNPGENIIPCGSNMKAGELALPANRRIRPPEIALLAELGQAEVRVRRQPRVVILATGDELVPVSATPSPGQIRNSNAFMLAAQVRAVGADPILLEIARDTRDDLRAKIEVGLESDFLCLSGGVSSGKLDLVPSALAAAGVQEVFHQVAMKPGKPIWFGKREHPHFNPCYVFGLPGNPVSSLVCFELFVRTAIRRFTGLAEPAPNLIPAKLTKKFQQRGDREVWFPALTEFDKTEIIVTPTNWNGSSDLRSTVEANSSLCILAGERTYLPGEVLPVLLWSGCEIASKLVSHQS